jgi:hypothetical protein
MVSGKEDKRGGALEVVSSYRVLEKFPGASG